MFFPFTFSISTPANPFAESADPGQIDYASPTRTKPRRPPPPAQRASQASTSQASISQEGAGLSRKRGRWSPDLKAPACSPTPDLTSTSAYIDSPTKYIQVDRTGQDDQDANNELRPAKRRRIVEITDSLISSAFSAAVIGTAVGLTAYRLWRDRGKEDSPPAQPIENFPPPPPYTERPEQPAPGHSYVPGGQASVPPPPASTAPPTPRRTPARPGRRTHMQNSRRKRPVTAVAPRNQSPAVSLGHTRNQSATSYHTAFTNNSSTRSTPGPSSSSYQPNTGPQSGDELDDDEMEMSGQMDWMSSRLQDLINQGKKALGTEIVVGGTDDVDDGCDGWDDAEPEATASQAQSSTGSGTTSRAATRTPILGRSSSRASGASRRKAPRVSSGSFSSSSARKHNEDDLGFEVLYQSPMRPAPSAKTTFDDDGTSEELRVAMERVRKAYGLR